MHVLSADCNTQDSPAQCTQQAVFVVRLQLDCIARPMLLLGPGGVLTLTDSLGREIRHVSILTIVLSTRQVPGCSPLSTTRNGAPDFRGIVSA